MPENTHAQFAQQQLWQSLQFRLGQAIIRVAEQGEIADTVSIWGDVRQPGVYLVPAGTTIANLVAYAGGPVVTAVGDAAIDWARYRVEISHLDHENKLRTFNFRYSSAPDKEMFRRKLSAWDQVNVQMRRRPNFRDYVLVIAPVISSLATTLLIIDRL
jgi:hypothetical protein